MSGMNPRNCIHHIDGMDMAVYRHILSPKHMEFRITIEYTEENFQIGHPTKLMQLGLGEVRPP